MFYLCVVKLKNDIDMTLKTDYFKNNLDVVAKLRKQAYLAEIARIIDLISQFCKSSVLVDGSLLSVEIFDDFGGRYNLTVDSDEDFKMFHVSLWFNGDSRFRSTFTNLSFVKQVVNMLLGWYIEEDDQILYR